MQETSLQKLRKSKNISQDTLAKLIGISRPTYQLIENNKKDLTITQAQRIAGFFGIDTDQVINPEKINSKTDYKIAKTVLPTDIGDFIMYVWDQSKGEEIIFLTTQKINLNEPVLVRVHSECATGDIFHSLRCDCGQQKDISLKMISESHNGVFIYLRQEGRGIGLYEKICSYALQDQGYDTHEANILLGHKPDLREYLWVKKVLQYLHVENIKLITNNPAKVSEIARLGINITERVPIVVPSNEHNRKYFETKKQKFKHFFGEESNYFYQFSYAENPGQIEEVGNFMKNFYKDPLLKICIGIHADSHTFNDKNKLQNIEKMFKVASHFEGFVPILHFTFNYSHDNKKDIAKIRTMMPYVQYLRLNDINEGILTILKYANQFFITDIPISEDTMYLLDDKNFIKEVQNKKTFIMIDNSHGKGIPDSYNNFMSKIDRVIASGINDIALCGGFGPGELSNYFKLKDHYKINFSIDAETKLKQGGSLDLERVKSYLSELLNHK
jgi:GTP cyclohydrolase II